MKFGDGRGGSDGCGIEVSLSSAAMRAVAAEVVEGVRGLSM